jgi:putative addiction module killer protein
MLRLNSPRRVPYREWFDSFKDKTTKARIRIRIDRVQGGNFGKHRVLGGGFIELKEDFGPGYRIYLGQDSEELIILLCGGDKSSQKKDIQLAQDYWQDYWRRK